MNPLHAKWRPEQHSKRREKRLYTKLLNNASQCLSFSEDVIREMRPIPYKEIDFSWLFHATGPLASSTKLKKIRRNKEIHNLINPLTQQAGKSSVQTSAKNDVSDVFRKTKPFGMLNAHTCLRETFIEDREAQNNRWPEFAANTNQQLQLRKKHRISDYIFSPASTNVQNHLNTKITVKHIEIPLAPRLHDILNPHASSHVSEQKIVSAGTNKALKEKQQWMDLQPTKIDYSQEHGLRPPDFIGQDSETPKLSVAEISALRYAVDKWRIACNVKLPVCNQSDASWQSVTLKSLQRNLRDPNYQVRLEAIITCASRAVHGPQVELDPGKAGQHWNRLKLKAITQKLQAIINAALNDPVKRVRTAAAVCQYAMKTPNAQARDILRSMIKQDLSGTGTDSWVAAQCLAIEGDVSQAVIQRILSQHFLRDAPSDQEKSMMLLSKISSKTTLVRSLLAEELNNANWNARVQACNSIAKLKSPINKDVCTKLLHVMWNDWSCAVRHAAALALSKLDAAKEMHAELSTKLEEGPSARRVEALTFIGQLNIMTPTLRPTFLRCFNDDCEAVRKQACLTAASLMMKDQMVLDQLINLMQNEPLWEVKVDAINALGNIGWLNPALQELLMWAVHHEEEPGVRVAACEALNNLGANGLQFQHFIEDRYTLERNAEVKSHIECLLKKHGYSLHGDQSKMNDIKLQVKLMCSDHSITQKMLLMDDQQQQMLLC
ncbi:HEAT repeat-containing protein 4 [Danio aesculapii]|uniref:HEAT repeat-containing protein 4 n=1 Tax=Danio aesculapii TaxID=1142201 RepID=UPI0024BF2F44|nr:HEAT repeat-containing protein 4 [Danio aesculapii]